MERAGSRDGERELKVAVPNRAMVQELYPWLLQYLGISQREIGRKRNKEGWVRYMLEKLWGVEPEEVDGAFMENPPPPEEKALEEVKRAIALQRKVRRAIVRLRAMGFALPSPPAVDGIVGWRTRRAIREIQRLLAELGLYEGPIDGLWGPKTERAYRALIKSPWGKIEKELTEGFRQYLSRVGVDWKAARGESFCATGVGYILNPKEPLRLPSTWEFYEEPNRAGMPLKWYVERKQHIPSVEELERMPEGTILIIHYPGSRYRRMLEERMGKDLPTHMMVKKGGRFYHVIGSTVYSLTPEQAVALLKAKGMTVWGIAYQLREKEWNVLPPTPDTVGLFADPKDLKRAIRKEANPVIRGALYLIASSEMGKPEGIPKRAIAKWLAEQIGIAKSLGTYQLRPDVVVDELPPSFWEEAEKRYGKIGKGREERKAFLRRVMTKGSVEDQTWVVAQYLRVLRDRVEALDKEILNHLTRIGIATRPKVRHIGVEDKALTLALYYHYGDYSNLWRQYLLANIYKAKVEQGAMGKLPIKPILNGKWTKEWEELSLAVTGKRKPSHYELAKLYVLWVREIPSAYIEDEKLQELEEYIRIPPYGRVHPSGWNLTSELKEKREFVLRS